MADINEQQEYGEFIDEEDSRINDASTSSTFKQAGIKLKEGDSNEGKFEIYGDFFDIIKLNDALQIEYIEKTMIGVSKYAESKTTQLFGNQRQNSMQIEIGQTIIEESADLYESSREMTGSFVNV